MIKLQFKLPQALISRGFTRSSDIEVPEDIIDRAHRIGRVYEGNESYEKRQDVIVRF